MAIGGERTEAMREDARNMRESVRRDNLEQKLEDVVKERPGVRPFLELRPLLMAVAIAAVLTLIVSLLFSVVLGALVLVVSFGSRGSCCRSAATSSGGRPPAPIRKTRTRMKAPARRGPR